MAKFCTAFLDENEPVIFGDGLQSRDFTFVENAVQANLLACEAPSVSGKVFNIGTGDRITLNDVVYALAQISGKPLKARHDPPRDGDIRDSQADIEQPAHSSATNPPSASKKASSTPTPGIAPPKPKSSLSRTPNPSRAHCLVTIPSAL